jgi:hypothetical protein
MSRIRAGSTLVNQYTPPFVVPDNVATNWHLRWSDDLRAFEAYDPNENVKEDAGFESIEVYGPIVGTGGQQFVLPWAVESKESLFITINGVKQHQSAYSINVTGNNTLVTMQLPVVAPNEIEFIGLQASDPADIKIYTAVGDGLTDTWIIPWSAPSAAALIITINGVKQSVSAYGITIGGNSTTVVFNGIPAVDAAIEILGIADTGEIPASPVEVSNLSAAPGTAGLFASKTTAGTTQILNFKALAQGTGITLTPATNFVTISAAIPTYASAGGTGIDPIIYSGNPVLVRNFAGADPIYLTESGGTITVRYDNGYVSTSGATYNAVIDDRIIGVANLAGAVTINLPSAATYEAGAKLIIKDQIGEAATYNITVDAFGTETIDGEPTLVINTDYGSVTLYTNGVNWFVVE